MASSVEPIMWQVVAHMLINLRSDEHCCPFACLCILKFQYIIMHATLLAARHKYIAEILIFEYAHHCILWIWCTPHNCNLLPYLVNIMHTVQHFDCALMSTPLPYLCSCKPWHKRYGWSFINHHKMHYFWLVIWLVLYLWVAVRWIFFSNCTPLSLKAKNSNL